MKKINFFADIILVFLFGLFQSLSLIAFYGVKPNFLLSLLVVLLFSVKNFWQYLILVLTAMLSLGYSVPVAKEIIVFGAIMLSAFYFKKYLTEHVFLSSFFLTAILTTALYAFIDYRFIFNNLNVFLLEMAYNLLISAILGFLLAIHI